MENNPRTEQDLHQEGLPQGTEEIVPEDSRNLLKPEWIR